MDNNDKYKQAFLNPVFEELSREEPDTMFEEPSEEELNRQYDGAYLDPMFESFTDMKHFMQDQLPPTPKPKEVKHVVLDADDTIWEMYPWSIISLAEPVGHTDKDLLPVALHTERLVGLIPDVWKGTRPTGHIKLVPHLRETLDTLDAKGIPYSIASINNRKAVLDFLDAFGLKERFSHVIAGYKDYKSDMVNKIAKKEGIPTEAILFVNDTYQNGVDVAYNTRATALILGYNIMRLEDLLEFIE